MSSIEEGFGPTMNELWLLKFNWPNGSPASALPELLRHHGSLQAWRSIEGELGYAYADTGLSKLLQQNAAPVGSWVQLACTLELQGASAGVAAPYHYVVETDVLPEHESDFNAWYNEEHLPGLAAVSGTVRAARYVASGSPRHYACYDLAALDAFGSPAWLAVRSTAWSARVRPAFRNTRRTMFQRASMGPASDS